jgi:CheY-like chemotaxis protein
VTAGKTVPVIDDEELVHETLSAFLETSGFEVFEADDGRSGMRQFEKQPTDLVLCDIIMEDMDGIETIQALKARAPEVKVIAITGGSQMTGMDYLEFARQLGADAVLKKPFKRDKLIETINGLDG